MEELVEDKSPVLLRDLGMRFPSEVSKQKARYGLYQCGYCEAEFEAMTAHIKSGNTKSCGCQKGGITHGLRNNQFYVTWKNMLRRCTNPKNKGYKNYGGRGITVCEEWLDIRNFIVWCESTHPNTNEVSLDRIDVNGNYEPNNCRWADASTQVLNQRMRRTNTSGYVGITWVESKLKWVSRITIEKKRIWLGDYKTLEEAVLARDNYIIENKLPHKLSTEY